MSRAYGGRALARLGRRLLAAAAAAVLVAGPGAAAAAAQTDGQWWNQQWEMHKVRPISDGSGVTVAVLDSGVDASVPELGGSVVPGADFTGQGGDGTTDNDPDSHGTAMAALITGIDPLGAAPEATILPVVVTTDEAGTSGSMDAYSEGIRFAVDNNARVINISLAAFPSSALASGECPPALLDAIRYAAANDVVMVAGSGNQSGGPTPVPGGCPGVLTVGANDAQLNPWQDSHRSEHVDVSAPGVSLALVGKDGRTGTGTGTSGATALVSAVVALMRAEFPDDSADDILRRIIHTAGDIHTDGWDDATGYGVVQPQFALTEPLPSDAPNPVYEGLEPAGTAPSEGGLPGASPLAPAGSAQDSDEDGGAIAPAWVLVIGGLFVVVVLVVVIVVVVATSNKNKRRPAPAQFPPPYPPGPPPPPPPGPYQGPGPRR